MKAEVISYNSAGATVKVNYVEKLVCPNTQKL